MKFNKKILAVAVLAVSGSAFAAVNPANPTVGIDNTIESTGSFDIFLRINHMVKVSGLDDIDLGSYDFASVGDAQGSDSFCVFANTPSFTVKASSAAGTGAFELQDADGNGYANIPYSVTYATLDNTGTAGPSAPLAHDTTVSVSETRQTLNCTSNGDNLQFNVTVAQNDIVGAFASNYSDTVTVVASPE